MNTNSNLLPARLWSGVLGMLCLVFPGQAQGGVTPPTAEGPPANRGEAIRWAQLGARAGADYQGEGLAVTPTAEGARLQCGFQKLEGRATAELGPGIGRPFGTCSAMSPDPALKRWAIVESPSGTELLRTGRVSVADKAVRFVRPGLVEEYSVSVDGVRQDFVVLDDTHAVYPLCIDPTFSDGNWVSMNASVPGAEGGVRPERHLV